MRRLWGRTWISKKVSNSDVLIDFLVQKSLILHLYYDKNCHNFRFFFYKICQNQAQIMNNLSSSWHLKNLALQIVWPPGNLGYGFMKKSQANIYNILFIANVYSSKVQMQKNNNKLMLLRTAIVTIPTSATPSRNIICGNIIAQHLIWCLWYWSVQQRYDCKHWQ